MKPTSVPAIFLTKPGLFVSIVASTIGIVSALNIILTNPQAANIHFMEIFGAVMLLNLFSAIRNIRKSFYVDKTTIPLKSRFNPFISVYGMITTTICSTTCLCLFIPLLTNNIAKGDVRMVALSFFTVIIQAYVFYRAIHDVHKYLRKKVPAMYQHQEFH